MIELNGNRLIFSFPDVHPQAQLAIEFQRTLRIPDDDTAYPLPPGLGTFPLRHVDDYAAGNVPAMWIEHGGIMLPMYQSEAMWLHFDSDYLMAHETAYPFALKIATGKINAVTGESWRNGLRAAPQDYLVAPEQPWLDGYCVEEGFIRQFVAMPLGAGYSAEEQITGEAEHGGLQIIVYPMKRSVFERRFPKRAQRIDRLACATLYDVCEAADGAAMGLAPGGRMRQEIYQDPFDINDWDRDNFSRCFVHIANSMVWRSITGQTPPTVPLTSKEYTNAGLPWFDYYHDDGEVVPGAAILKGLKSVVTIGKEKGHVPLPENEPITPEYIIALRKDLRKNQVREGSF
jgi:hypothetical protein